MVGRPTSGGACQSGTGRGEISLGAPQMPWEWPHGTLDLRFQNRSEMPKPRQSWHSSRAAKGPWGLGPTSEDKGTVTSGHFNATARVPLDRERERRWGTGNSNLTCSDSGIPGLPHNLLLPISPSAYGIFILPDAQAKTLEHFSVLFLFHSTANPFANPEGPLSKYIQNEITVPHFHCTHLCHCHLSWTVEMDFRLASAFRPCSLEFILIMAAGVSLLKCKLTCAQNSPVDPSSLLVKAKVLTTSSKALPGLSPLTHCALTKPGSLLSLKNSSHDPASVPLHWLLPLLRKLFPQAFEGSVPAVLLGL